MICLLYEKTLHKGRVEFDILFFSGSGNLIINDGRVKKVIGSYNFIFFPAKCIVNLKADNLGGFSKSSKKRQDGNKSNKPKSLHRDIYRTCEML